jgi:hypothetical protein
MFVCTLSSGGSSGAGTELGPCAGVIAGGSVTALAASDVAWEGESMMGGRTPEFCGGRFKDICATAQNQV